MQTPPIDEKSIIHKLISDALFNLADSIDKHAAQQFVLYSQFEATQDHNDPETGGQQMSQRHAWFSLHGGFGDKIYPYGQNLLNIAVLKLGLNQSEFNEYFRSDGNRDSYSITAYLSRVHEKTNHIRILAAQLVPEEVSK